MVTVKEKNKAYTLNQLTAGDRFYFVNDKKKKVFMLDDPPFETKKGYGGIYIKFAIVVNENFYDRRMKLQLCKADRVVIFLRNQKDGNNH